MRENDATKSQKLQASVNLNYHKALCNRLTKCRSSIVITDRPKSQSSIVPTIGAICQYIVEPILTTI